jgi:DNA-binding FadR family transcriptional regulator
MKPAKRTSLRLNSFASTSVVHRVADEMRQAILALDEGAYLGSEDTLSTQLGVSPPTLRQATRLLEHEQLLTIKRGASGGYYTRRPEMAAASHMAAIYLSTHSASVQDNYDIVTNLSPLVMELACRCERPDLLQRLKAYADGELPPQARGAHGPTAGELEFIQLIAAMTENVSLQLILTILVDYGRLTSRASRGLDARAAARFRDGRRQLSQAILDRDLATAKALHRERQDLMMRHRTGAPPSFRRVR